MNIGVRAAGSATPCHIHDIRVPEVIHTGAFRMARLGIHGEQGVPSRFRRSGLSIE
jgi:hypothetical protein